MPAHHRIKPCLLSAMLIVDFQARKRHIAKKKNVLESYASTTEEVETSVNSLFDEHEEKA